MAKLLLLLLTFAVAPAYGVSIYKWTDKEGQIHYTRTPPPKSQTSDKVESKDADSVPASRVEDNAETKQPVADKKTASPTMAPPTVSDEAQKRQELCRSAQNQLNEMRRTDKVVEHGHEIEITEDERLRRLDETIALVNEYCKPRRSEPVPKAVEPAKPQPVQQPASEKASKTAPKPRQAEPNIENKSEPKSALPLTQPQK